MHLNKFRYSTTRLIFYDDRAKHIQCICRFSAYVVYKTYCGGHDSVFYVMVTNIGPFIEIMKMGNRVVIHPSHQDAQLQNQNNLLQAQQVGNYCFCVHAAYFFTIG